VLLEMRIRQSQHKIETRRRLPRLRSSSRLQHETRNLRVWVRQACFVDLIPPASLSSSWDQTRNRQEFLSLDSLFDHLLCNTFCQGTNGLGWIWT
jgi:hypothetical protein